MNEWQLLESASNKKVLFLGEKIIDVYNYVKPLGRPTKDAIICVELVGSESFDGGVIATAAHVQDLCQVRFECLGDVYQKIRWIESSHHRKLFECYVNGSRNSKDLSPELYKTYDAVVVTDYGHGMADKAFIESLAEAKYLAVNVQTNSGNYGFNLATKYPYADYLCVDEAEARLATQNRAGPIEDSLLELAKRAGKVIITLGKDGAIGYEEESGIVRSSAVTETVVDTIGAGDAFFAVTAIVSEHGSVSELLRIGNAAGAIKAGIIGHQRSITKDELKRTLQGVSLPSDARALRGGGKRRAI